MFHFTKQGPRQSPTGLHVAAPTPLELHFRPTRLFDSSLACSVHSPVTCRNIDSLDEVESHLADRLTEALLAEVVARVPQFVHSRKHRLKDSDTKPWPNTQQAQTTPTAAASSWLRSTFLVWPSVEETGSLGTLEAPRCPLEGYCADPVVNHQLPL